jgi:hypothetical protein
MQRSYDGFESRTEATIASSTADTSYYTKPPAVTTGTPCYWAALQEPHPHVVIEPASAFEQHHALLHQKVAECAVQLLVAQQVVKRLLALRAPLLAQRPLQDAVDCRTAVEAHGNKRILACE